MGRLNRQISSTDIYHIILRGVNQQDIFLEDSDKNRFLETIKRYCSELNANTIAYCLMNNHVHLLIHVLNSPDLLMKEKCREARLLLHQVRDRNVDPVIRKVRHENGNAGVRIDRAGKTDPDPFDLFTGDPRFRNHGQSEIRHPLDHRIMSLMGQGTDRLHPENDAEFRINDGALDIGPAKI